MRARGDTRPYRGCQDSLFLFFGALLAFCPPWVPEVKVEDSRDKCWLSRKKKKRTAGPGGSVFVHVPSLHHSTWPQFGPQPRSLEAIMRHLTPLPTELCHDIEASPRSKVATRSLVPCPLICGLIKLIVAKWVIVEANEEVARFRRFPPYRSLPSVLGGSDSAVNSTLVANRPLFECILRGESFARGTISQLRGGTSLLRQLWPMASCAMRRCFASRAHSTAADLRPPRLHRCATLLPLMWRQSRKMWNG